MPVTSVPQNVCTISPTTGIAATPVLAIKSPTIVPATTLAPVAIIFVAALNLSPKGRKSGLNNRIFVASTNEAHDCRIILTTFLAVVKNILQSVVVKEAKTPPTAPSMNLCHSSLYLSLAFSKPLLTPKAMLLNKALPSSFPCFISSRTANQISLKTKPSA